VTGGVSVLGATDACDSFYHRLSAERKLTRETSRRRASDLLVLPPRLHKQPCKQAMRSRDGHTTCERNLALQAPPDSSPGPKSPPTMPQWLGRITSAESGDGHVVASWLPDRTRKAMSSVQRRWTCRMDRTPLA
jgi:hypothetical protein